MLVAWRYVFTLALILVCVSAASGQAPALTIDRVVARFLERNLAVEAARHRVDIARAEQIAAQLRPNPTLTLSAENLKFAGPTPAGDLYEVGATYSQPIERSDKRRHRREVADSTVAVAEAELAETLSQRLLDVKRAFYETLLARRAADQAVDNLRAFEGLVAVTEARFKEGAVAEGEVLKVRLERARFDSAIAHAQLVRRQAGIKLLDLLGETDFSGAGAVTGEPVLSGATIPDVTMLRTEALQRRPSVQAAEHSVLLAERTLALERSRSTADVSPFVGLRRVGENSTVLLGIAIPLPFTDRNEGGIARAAAEERVARTELALRKNRVLAEVESAYQAWQSARQRMNTFETGLLRQADESQSIALRAYQEGAVELLGYLEAQRTRADIHYQYLQAVLDARTALLVLEQATGRELTR
jgi:cobalt-zinc-cadmium efflux system outer membrane protein